jgi:GNAT superfamily N-acetyltransferase
MTSPIARRPAGVRPAVEGDLDDLVRLLGQLFSIEADFRPEGARQRRGLARMLEEPSRRLVLVAEAAGEVVGLVTVQLVVSTAEGADSAWVEDLVVDEAHRGGGLGQRLLEEAEAWAEARGATRLQLLADATNVGALRFYARMGWSPTRLVCLRRGGVR